MKIPSAPPTHEVPSIWQLFLSFFRLGLTAFGGPAMIPYIRKFVVERHKWLDDRAFRDGLALCQTIPGATAMQITAYSGLRVRGLGGAGASFVGFGLPAFILMLILSILYVATQSVPQVVAAFNGLQAVVVAIIANAAILFARNYVKTWQSVVIVVVATASFWFGLNPIAVIVLAAIIGFLILPREAMPHAATTPARSLYTTRALVLLVTVVALGFLVLYLFQPELFDLAALMFRIDLFAFGGGFTAVPFMFHEVVDVRGWMDGPTFLNGMALGQITPGPIVITATFVGYLLYGAVGAAIATVAIFLPSFLIIVAITPYFDRLRENRSFNKAIRGISVSFVGLLLVTTVHFAQNIPWDLPRIILAGGAFAALLLKVDILWVVLATVVISVFILG